MDGTILNDRYQLLQILGRKPGRRTWQAMDLQTAQPVVVKLLLFGMDFEWEALKLFEREAQILQALDHPAIPKYLDWFETLGEASGFALVQTYIPARSLDVIVKSGRTFLAKELREIAQQILQVLDYLHQRNPAVIHRDLKPSNILLGDRSGHSIGQVFLVDFGSVQNLAMKSVGTMTIVGTYGYMPMEQFGDRAVPASDLYSLGATMLFLATGREPADLIDDENRLQFAEISTLSVQFNAWLRNMTEVSFKKRPASAMVALDLLKTPKKLSGDLSSIDSAKQLMPRQPKPFNCRYILEQRSASKVFLSVPVSCLKLQEMKAPSWLSQTGCLYIVIIPIQIIVTVIIFKLFSHGFMVLLISLFVGVFLGIDRSKKRRIITISESEIAITYPTWLQTLTQNDLVLSSHERNWTLEKRIPRHKVWELEYFLPHYSSRNNYYLNLKVANQVWRIRGTRQEIQWLVGELSHHLQLPAISSTSYN
jgi:serine/threonine protein kinase